MADASLKFKNQTGRSIYGLLPGEGYLGSPRQTGGDGILQASRLSVSSFKFNHLSVLNISVISPLARNVVNLDLRIRVHCPRAELKADAHKMMGILGYFKKLKTFRFVLAPTPCCPRSLNIPRSLNMHYDPVKLSLEDFFFQRNGSKANEQGKSSMIGCKMPALEHVNFINWPISVAGLALFISTHSDTLKRLELAHITLHGHEYVQNGAWDYIAGLIREKLPLASCRFVKLTKCSTAHYSSDLFANARLQEQNYKRMYQIASGEIDPRFSYTMPTVRILPTDERLEDHRHDYL